MQAYWFRRRDSKKQWWSFYVADAESCPDLADALALADQVGHRVYLLASKPAEFEASIRHELGHIEQWANGLEKHSHHCSREHRAIEAAAVFRMPKRMPPTLDDD